MKFDSVGDLQAKGHKKFLGLTLSFSSIEKRGAWFYGSFEGKEVKVRITDDEKDYMFKSHETVSVLINNYDSVFVEVGGNVILDQAS